MKPITKENFKEVLNSKQAVLFMYKPSGCGNCEQMKPIMERFAQNNPDVNVFSYECGATPDEVSGKYQFKMFPGIFSFVDGRPMRGYSGMKSPKQLSMLFMEADQMKVIAFDAQMEAEFFKKEIMEYNQGTQIVESKVEPVVPKVTPELPIDPADDTICDSCQ